MFDKNEFRSALVKRGKTMTDLADAMEIDVATLSRKVNGHSEFTRKEIQFICEFLEVSDPKVIFFT